MTGYTPAQLARLLGAPEPTTEQSAVVGAPLAPMAVIAGAGSGKSETMAARLVWLVANGMVRPERVLGLTFTRKAAAELGERVRARLDGLRRAGLRADGGPGSVQRPGGTPDEALDPLAGQPVIATYHAYAGRLVAEHALRAGVEPSSRLITPAVCWQLAARVVAAYDGPLDATDWTPATVTAAVLALAGEMSEHLREGRDIAEIGGWLSRAVARACGGGQAPKAVTDVLRTQRVREQLVPLVAAYARAKADREAIDYGDQVALAARIAAAHPAVSRGERSRYQVVLLDEFQDTSHAQLVLLRALFGDGHPVTAVGDPCQSIYGWRGASAGNLRRFRTDFALADGSPARVALLSTSFRNTGRVLAAAGAVQADLRASARDVPVLMAPPARAGRGLVRCALLETVRDEAAWIADHVAALLRLPPGLAPDGGPWPDGGRERIRPRDIAVLCRKRSQFAAVRAALEERAIPVEVVGLGGLLTVPEVADIVATLQVIHDPSASAALARLLTSPRWRIGPADLVALGRRARALANAGRERTGAAGRDQEPIAAALDELARDPGSLIEALDDLGGPAGYSPAGHGRLTALAAELRTLRAQAGRPLAELVTEVERALGLDIEVAARPGADPAAVRADLDAFADAAAAFAGDADNPTLGAFLAYLAAAETEEFGLEAGRVGDTDSVKLATVHAVKGLQWPAVFVAGLADGPQRHVFPARPLRSTRWTDNARLLPFSLRGDAADLPVLAGLSSQDLAEFTQRCKARDLAEERRLAYVAATRAAYLLGCSGYWWSDGASRLGPSPFLAEVRAACAQGAGEVDAWFPEPVPDAVNPALAEPRSAAWPPTGPAGPAQQAVREAAAMVEAKLRGLASAPQQEGAGPGVRAVAPGAEVGDAARGAEVGDAARGAEVGDAARGAEVADAARGAEVAAAAAEGEVQAAAAEGGAGAAERYRELVAAWTRDTGLLLAERERRQSGRSVLVGLPRHLPVSALVTMAKDPADLAQQIRRPMPRRPAPSADLGTAFHQWLEHRFGQVPLIDSGELPGAADDHGPPGEAELSDLKAAFEAGEWADRWPAEVEVAFETVIGGRMVRGRIDAVFRDARDGRYDVVDWKTGRQPGAPAERRAVAVQLAVYRLAWAALAAVPVSQVRAAFYYVRDRVTVRPADLLEEPGLTALVNGTEVS